MKIVWVKAGKLLPLDTGGRIRSYQILRQLIAEHQVKLLTYYKGKRDVDYERDIQSIFAGATTFYTPSIANPTIRDVLGYMLNLTSATPFAVSKFAAANVHDALKVWFEGGAFDVAVCDFLSASPGFPSNAAIPTVLFQHNVESLLWQRQAQCETNWLKKLVYQAEAGKMRRYEDAALAKFDHIIAVSESDRDLMAQVIDAGRISVVPTGVDLEAYRALRQMLPVPGLIVFVGSMDWEPNVDAAEYFCNYIWPVVKQEVPSASFRIVGRNPPSRVKKLASD